MWYWAVFILGYILGYWVLYLTIHSIGVGVKGKLWLELNYFEVSLVSPLNVTSKQHNKGPLIGAVVMYNPPVDSLVLWLNVSDPQNFSVRIAPT